MTEYNLEEPIFFVNDYLETGQKELEKVILELKREPMKDEHKARFLRNYVNLLFHAYKQKQYEKIKPRLEAELRQKEELKQQLKHKRKELMQRLELLKNPPKHIEKPEFQKNLILSKISDRVLASRKITDHTYELIEPFLKDEEREIVNKLKQQEFNEENIKNTLQEKLQDRYNKETYERLRYHVVRDTQALGQISPLLEEEELTEIICSGINEPLTLTIKGEGLQTNITYPSAELLNEQIKIFAKDAKQEISEEKPFLDTQLQKGWHVQANLGTEYSKPRFIIHK